jgi:xylose isomerase
MKENKSLHSICRWTFNAGRGGFVSDDMRPEWNS